MAKARAIVKRRKAVTNIRKITRTMELIATARFKKAMDRATEAAAYTRKLSEIVADLSAGNLEFKHPLLQARESEENAILLVLTSNRGLCGAYNSGVLRQATVRIRKAHSANRNLQVEVSGKRGINSMRFQGHSVAESFMHFEDKPTFEEVDVLGSRYADLYSKGQLDRLDVAYMEYQSSSRQAPTLETLLPITALATKASAGAPHESQSVAQTDYEFLPSSREILQEIVPASFKARLFKCFLDAAVSEQIARMVAMKAATENAGDMIQTLSMQYNRARQTQITSELSEIIGGAAALE